MKKNFFLSTLLAAAAAFSAQAQCVVGPDAGTYPCTVDVPAQTIIVPSQSITVPGQKIQLQVTVKAQAIVESPPVVTALAQIPGAGSPIVSTGSTISTAANGITSTRITKSGALIVGGVRAERAWTGQQLVPGRDYWMAFSVRIPTGSEGVPRASSKDDDMLVFQTHTPSQGNTTPDISLCIRGQDTSMRWEVAYNTKPSNTWKWVGGTNPDTEKVTTFGKEPMPAAGTWTRFVVHYRPGYTTAHQPRTRVWRALQGGDFALAFDSTGFNTYNSLNGPSYPRIGPYKWKDSDWTTASALSFDFSPLYFGEGADLLEAGKAAVSGYRN